MKGTNAQGNGNSDATRRTFTTEVIEENSYLQRAETDDGDRTTRAESEDFDQIIDDDDGAPIELEDQQRKRKQRRRRLAVMAIGALLLMALVFAIALYRLAPTRVQYGQAPRENRALPQVPTSVAPSRDTRTDKAIEEAKKLTAVETTTNGQSAKKAEAKNPVLDTPFKFPSDPNETINPATSVTTSNTNNDVTQKLESRSSTQLTTSSDGSPRGIHSQRSSETSLYMSEPVAERLRPTLELKDRSQKHFPSLSEKRDAVTLPGFASMLPVRTVGALYSLRTGALVRLELTRETQGDGWSMKRGTILVGTTKGGDLDRAYVSLIGFIDPQNGKLVKLEGDLLGGDGAAGLKGKRRQLDGGWTRALGRFASSALDVTGALLSGRGGDTVVISDGLRTKAINPVTDELSGVLGSELDRRQGRSFVEVTAGTSGYILVTQLPSAIEGKPATPEVNSETLAALSDVDEPRESTGLSERELADLLANGSQHQIRAALPRMSPEMRKIAEAVLRP